MQLYKVKLLTPESVLPENNHRGYLACVKDELGVYTRKEALKKAIFFNGKIEPHGRRYTVNNLRILQLAKSEISKDVLRLLQGRETYKDLSDLNEPLYYGDVFMGILGEQHELDEILGEQHELDETLRCNEFLLDELTILDMLTSNFEYVMISSFY